jgi:hypothetical protein
LFKELYISALLKAQLPLSPPVKRVFPFERTVDVCWLRALFIVTEAPTLQFSIVTPKNPLPTNIRAKTITNPERKIFSFTI